MGLVDSLMHTTAIRHSCLNYILQIFDFIHLCQGHLMFRCDWLSLDFFSLILALELFKWKICLNRTAKNCWLCKEGKEAGLPPFLRHAQLSQIVILATLSIFESIWRTQFRNEKKHGVGILLYKDSRVDFDTYVKLYSNKCFIQITIKTSMSAYTSMCTFHHVDSSGCTQVCH